MDLQDQSALKRACSALWLATLSLMTAFMRTSAPAHRYLLARRIAANFGALSAQPCFSNAPRGCFFRLGERWTRKAGDLAPPRGSAAAGSPIGAQ